MIYQKWNLKFLYSEQCVLHILEDVYCENIFLEEIEINENVHMFVDIITKYIWKKKKDLENYFK
jgi:phosphoketolase